MIRNCSSLFKKNVIICLIYVGDTKILRSLRFYLHVVFKHCVFKNNTALTLLQFSQCDISIHTSAFLNVTWYRI
jgi:hypothetical protein